MKQLIIDVDEKQNLNRKRVILDYVENTDLGRKKELNPTRDLSNVER